VFRKAVSRDLDAIHQLLVEEAAHGRFDRRLVEEPYRSGLRQNLKHIRKRGQRLDEELKAQLLVWENDAGEAAGCAINSAISAAHGNEIWMVAVFPEYRGQGHGHAMNSAILSYLHPRVDVFSRCTPEAQVYFQMNLRRGFLPLEVTPLGVRVMKLPKLGAVPDEPGKLHQQLEPFVELP